MFLTYQDLQPALYVDLTNPKGHELADALIAGTQAFIFGIACLGFLIERVETTDCRPNGQSLV